MSDADDPAVETGVALVEQRSAGYGRPPVEHRFQKGHSGNPRGRPRKKQAAPVDAVPDTDIHGLVISEAMRLVQVTENGKTFEMPTAQAILRSLNVSALKGNHRAQVVATQNFKAAQDKLHADRGAIYAMASGYKQDFLQVFADYDRLDLPRPDPLPHPDDIQIDDDTLEVRCNGPWSVAEKAAWDAALALKAELKEERDALLALMAEDPELAPEWERDLAIADYIYRFLDQTVPDEATRRVPGFDLQAWRQRRFDKTLKRPTFK